MSSHNENHNGLAGNSGAPMSMGPTMYNTGQPGLGWSYGGVTGATQQKDDVAATMSQMSLNGYANPATHNPNGLLSMAMNNLIASGGAYYQLPDGRVLSSRLPATTYPQLRNDGSHPQPSVPSIPFTGLVNPNAVGVAGAPNLPWNFTAHAAQAIRGDMMPDLTAPRRNSFSSNEENGPRTPFIGASSQAEAQPKIVLGGSPHTWTTPSPHQLNSGSPPFQIAKSPTGQYYFADLTAICLQDLPIPKPIPAIFSGEKGRGTLEKSLQNGLNTTNVYIRGLHPNTTDEMLHTYGARFGKIISAKSMLDQETGNCKGFGFIKYHNFSDGENCIRAFFHWGYEAKWARVSHNEKLKTLGDENNTNLYVSNLPIDFNEHSLMAIFDDHEVLSAKILRDANGMSRGVGFARFSSPDICRQVIDQYNGVKVGDEGFTLSIRFADTPEQKKLKSVTAERRQYKAAEYNTAAYSPGSPYAATVSTTTYNSPLQPRMTNSYWPTNLPASVAPFYTTYAATPTPNLAFQTSGKLPGGVGQENADLGRSRPKDDSPRVVHLPKQVSTYISPAKSDAAIQINQRNDQSDHANIKSSPIKPNEYSPIKNSPSKASITGSMLRS